MLAFGHLGITLGAALLARGVVGRVRPPAHEDIASVSDSSRTSQVPKRQNDPSNKSSELVSFIRHIDIRLLLVGSLLPDIIDKPLGQIIFRESISNGRIFCHTLLFLLLITLGGIIVLRRSHRNWLLVLALGTFSHHILDGMWQQPRILYWPVLGLTFPRVYLQDYLQVLFQSLLTSPRVYIPEAIGLVIFAALVWWLIRRKALYSFIRNGQIPD